MNYRPRREWAWDEKAEEAYRAKRARMAEKGIVTDEDVCRFFELNGVPDVDPKDVRAIMLDSITASPLERVLSSLS